MENLQHIYISEYNEKLDIYYAEGYPCSSALQIIGEAIEFMQNKDSVMTLQVDDLVSMCITNLTKIEFAVEEYNEKLYEAVKRTHKEKRRSCKRKI